MCIFASRTRDAVKSKRESRSFLYYLALGVGTTELGRQGCNDYAALLARLTAKQLEDDGKHFAGSFASL
jgi:hypothetical protein